MRRAFNQVTCKITMSCGWCLTQQFRQTHATYTTKFLRETDFWESCFSKLHWMLDVQVLVNIFLSYTMNSIKLGKYECLENIFLVVQLAPSKPHLSYLLTWVIDRWVVCIQCNCASLTVNSNNNGLSKTEDLRNSSICSMSCGLPNLSRFGSGLWGYPHGSSHWTDQGTRISQGEFYIKEKKNTRLNVMSR